MVSSSKKKGRRPRITLQIPPNCPEKAYCALFNIYLDSVPYNLDKDFTIEFLDWIKMLGRAKTLRYKTVIVEDNKEKDLKSIYSLMYKRHLD